LVEDGLSLDERNHLIWLCLAPFLVVLFALIAYWVILEWVRPLKASWDFLLWVGLPLSIVLPVAILLPYEVFFPRRIRKSAAFHAKRFARRAAVVLAILLSLEMTMSVSVLVFEARLGNDAFLLGIVIWTTILLAVYVPFLRRRTRTVAQNF
jgi:MFS family permease